VLVAFRHAGLRGEGSNRSQESTLCARLRGRRRVAARFFTWRRFWNHHETKISLLRSSVVLRDSGCQHWEWPAILL